MLAKIFQQITQKKITIGIILTLIISGYFGYKNLFIKDDTKSYATTEVKRGDLTVSVSGSGQVSVSDQLNIKSKVSGDIVYVGVQNGQEVKRGALLAQIDIHDAEKLIRDNKTELETAQLELEELLSPPNELVLLQAENDLAQTKESKQRAEDNIEKAYEDAFNTVALAFLDLPTTVTGLRDILYSYEIAKSETNISDYSWNVSVFKNYVGYENGYEEKTEIDQLIDNSISDYEIAREKYEENFENYQNASRYSEKETVEILLNETIEAAKAIAETVKRETSVLDYWVDYRSQESLQVFNKISEYQTDLKGYTSNTNNHLLSLLSIQRSLQDNREELINAERLIEEKELSLLNLKTGADDLEIRAQNIIIQQKKDALFDAELNLTDHYIYAPFEGIISSTVVKKNESVSSNAIITTLITKQKIAEIILNEIDIAKVKNGQEVNITFDAIEDLNIIGEVIEIDTLGSITQGVVTYDIKIAFDIQDERVKPGMSLSVSIITEIRENILFISSSAISEQGEMSYVNIVKGIAAKTNQITKNTSKIVSESTHEFQKQPIQIGISNDTMTEVIDGLKEGDIIVMQAISSDAVLEERTGTEMQGMMRMMK